MSRGREQQFLAARRARMLALLEEQGYDCALVGDPLSFYYFTGVMIRPFERFLALLFRRTPGDCLAIIPAADHNAMAPSGVPELNILDTQAPLDVLRGQLAGAKTLAVEMRAFSMQVGLSLQQLSISLTDISAPLQAMRTVKDALEIELLQQAATAAAQALAVVQAELRPGLTEKGLALRLYEEMLRLPGVNQADSMPLGGAHCGSPHGVPGEYALQMGDAVTIDFGARCGFYWSDITRTFFLGKPQPKLAQAYEVVLEAQQAAIAAIRPGVEAGLIDRIARDVITKAGYGAYFLHRVGHGLGLDVHEAPSIHGENRTLLQEGMVFTVEPGIYFQDYGGIRIEDDVCVTKDGVRVLSSYAKTLPEMILT